MKTIRLRLISPRFIRFFGAALLVVGLHAVPAAADQTASENPPKAVSTQSNRASGDGNPESEAKGTGERQTSAHSAKPRPRTRFTVPKPHRPQPVARQRTLPGAASPAYVRSSAPAHSAAVVNRGSVQNEAIYRALPVRSGSAIIRPGTAAGGNLRHRDPNPPVIGGAASSRSRNTASIDGMQTNLKHSRN